MGVNYYEKKLAACLQCMFPKLCQYFSLFFFFVKPSSEHKQIPFPTLSFQKNQATTYPLKVPVNHTFQRVGRKIKYLFSVIETNKK